MKSEYIDSRGAVLISVVLLVALATSVASFLAWQQSVWLRQMENLRARSQADLIARSGVDVAREWLHSETAAADKAIGDWSISLPPLAAESGYLSGELRDQQGLLNLNNIVSNGAETPDFIVLKRLFELLKIDERPLAALRDWLDSDEDVSPGGAESQTYLALEPAYRSANQALTSIENLYRVAGFDDKIIATIRPYVTVLPAASKLNLNTAPAEILAARFAMPLGEAEVLALSRQQNRFANLDDFINRVPLAYRNNITNKDNLTFVSEYFLTVSRAELANANVAYRALLRRTQGQLPSVAWLRLERTL